MGRIDCTKLAAAAVILGMLAVLAYIIGASRQTIQAGGGLEPGNSTHVRQIDEAMRQAEKSLGG